MKVIVDTSVWVEFFRTRPRLSKKSLDLLSSFIEKDQVVTLYPIEAELFSGSHDKKTQKLIRDAFTIMEHVDLDWNARATWEKLIKIGYQARENSLRIPGIVDRMILSAAYETKAVIWTLDQALLKVAELLKIKIIHW